jgi:Xaa-Pro aminopeptidase
MPRHSAACNGTNTIGVIHLVTPSNTQEEINLMLLQEKAEQAHKLLEETNLDCWLSFVRETDFHPDPGVEMVVGADVTRYSAFLLFRNGHRVGIVANFDVANVRAGGVFADVIGTDEDIRQPLLATLRRHDPQTIGLNFSADDVTADGLTHGQWLRLNELLHGTPFAGRLTSAAPLLGKLRGRKSAAEVARIRQAANPARRERATARRLRSWGVSPA